MNSGVATVDTWTPSRRIQAAAAAENERVEREIARLDARASELTAELAAIQTAREELEHQRRVLNHFTNGREPARGEHASRRLEALPDPRGAVSNGATLLKGASIRKAAVRVLAATHERERPVHYRDWFALLTAQGFLPGGKDPLATFLTQVSRSPLVKRTTTAGVYVLDHDFPSRARERVAMLNEQLLETQQLPPHATVNQIAESRERGAQLLASLHETERQLDEALRSLGENDT